MILNGLGILIELLRRRRATQYHDIHDATQLPSVVVAVAAHFPECCTYLRSRFCMTQRKTTFGVLAPPLGLARQAILELVESVVLTNSAFVFDALLHSGLMRTLIDLFFQYKWNNFAHQSVFNVLTTVLPSPHVELARHVLVDCGLVDRILTAEHENAVKFASTNVSYGYIGHLTKISALINRLSARDAFVRDYLTARPEWSAYVDSALSRRVEQESHRLGGGRASPHLEPMDEDDSDDDDPAIYHGFGGSDDEDDTGNGEDDDLNVDMCSGYDWSYERVPEDVEPRMGSLVVDYGSADEDEEEEEDHSGGAAVDSGNMVLSGDSSDSDEDEQVVDCGMSFDDSDNEDSACPLLTPPASKPDNDSPDSSHVLRPGQPPVVVSTSPSVPSL